MQMAGGEWGDRGSSDPRGEVWGEQNCSPFVSEQTPPPCSGPSPGGVGRL